MSKKVWLYILCPVIIFNIIPVCIFGAAFAWAYAQTGNTEKVNNVLSLFWLYVAICIVNWRLAIFAIQKFRQEGKSLRELIPADGNLAGFNYLY